MAGTDWGTVLGAMLGGGILAGSATLVRAFAHRGTARTDDWEQTVGLTEKLLARRTREVEQTRARADRAWDELDKVKDQLAEARRELRTYQRRYGELSSPNLPKVEGEP
jgi:septation ring formation regulator EzrA